jgi:hypothetical protein
MEYFSKWNEIKPVTKISLSETFLCLVKEKIGYESRTFRIMEQNRMNGSILKGFFFTKMKFCRKNHTENETKNIKAA